MPWPLYPRYPLDRRLGGSQSRFGRGGEEKNYQPLPGLEPPIIQPVVQRYTTDLSRLAVVVVVVVVLQQQYFHKLFSMGAKRYLLLWQMNVNYRCLNEAQQKIFTPKEEEVCGQFRKLHNEELRDFYRSKWTKLTALFSFLVGWCSLHKARLSATVS
jgi:hypothetical protein